MIVKEQGKYNIQSSKAAFVLGNDISTKLDLIGNLVFKYGTQTGIVFNPLTPINATDTYRFYSV